MKKILFLFIALLFFTNSLLSNPYPEPRAIISELMFDEFNYWFLEIRLLYTDNNHKDNYESIWIETSDGLSKIRLDNISESTNLFVITCDSLTNQLSLNREGDYIKLYSFLTNNSPEPIIDSLCFGNYQGATIDSLPTGYSIVKLYQSIFCKDMNPTIGLPNDSAGTCGILKGHIYDKNNKLIIEGNFVLDNTFSFLNDSTYLTTIFSRKVGFNRLYFHGTVIKPFINIDTIELNINPGVQYEKDIHILDDFSGVEENAYKPDYEIRVINYPNPFNSSTNFAITIPSSQKYRQKQINIYNVLGQRINSIALSNQSSVQWDGKDFDGKAAATGTYYYQLVLDNKIYKSGSMILLK